MFLNALQHIFGKEILSLVLVVGTFAEKRLGDDDDTLEVELKKMEDIAKFYKCKYINWTNKTEELIKYSKNNLEYEKII